MIVVIIIKYFDYMIRIIVLYLIKYFFYCNNIRSKNDFRKNSIVILCFIGKMVILEIRYEIFDLKVTYLFLVIAVYVRV